MRTTSCEFFDKGLHRKLDPSSSVHSQRGPLAASEMTS